jgi:hypothetical protein
VVSVDAGQLLLGDAERQLSRIVDAIADDLDAAFAEFLLRRRDVPTAKSGAVQRALSRQGAERSYRDVATLGFLASALPGSIPVVELDELVSWLSGTAPFVGGVPTGIVEDRVALLGVALASRHATPANGARLREWLGAIVLPTPDESPQDSALLAAAAAAAGLPPLAVTNLAPDAELALSTTGLLSFPANAVAIAHLSSLQAGDVSHEPRHATIQLAALNAVRTRLSQINVAAPTVADVRTLLGRTSHSLQEWTWEERGRTTGAPARQWHIDNEYHVQSLLWAILSPLFPDITREEYVEAVGPLQPRTDIGLPSIRLVVEAKFWRKKLSKAKIVEQIASDVSLYFASAAARYDSLVVVIWDNARRTEDHSSVIRGIRALPRVSDAVILSRPARFDLDHDETDE